MCCSVTHTPTPTTTTTTSTIITIIVIVLLFMVIILLTKPQKRSMLTQDCFCMHKKKKKKGRKTQNHLYCQYKKIKKKKKYHPITLPSKKEVPLIVFWAEVKKGWTPRRSLGRLLSLAATWLEKGQALLPAASSHWQYLPQPIFSFNRKGSCAEKDHCLLLRMWPMWLESLSPGIINHTFLCCSLMLNTSSVQYFKHFCWSRPILIFWK